MIDFVSDNWQILTAVAGAFAYMYRQILATRKGIRALLRADLIRLYNKYHDDIIISIMNQYTPVRKLKYEELNDKVSDSDYDELINYAYDLGVRNAFIQEGETQKTSFIPNFDIFRAI